jgi:hypothetical protein
MSPWGMMLVVRALLNSRLEKSALFPLVLSCPPENPDPAHSKLHEASFEKTSEWKGGANNLVLFDGSKVAAVK